MVQFIHQIDPWSFWQMKEEEFVLGGECRRVDFSIRTAFLF